MSCSLCILAIYYVHISVVIGEVVQNHVRMRIKIKAGARSAILSIDKETSVSEISSYFNGTPLEGVLVLSYRYGFPAKTVDANSSQTLEEAGIKASEQLVAETGNTPNDKISSEAKSSAILQSSSKSHDTSNTTNDKIANVHIPELNAYLILRNVPDDNSCLFNAILYALTGKFKWPDMDLRSIVAEAVKSNPQTYDEVVLGRSNEKYCEWIRKLESWGGAIELGILAEFLGVRIICFDVELGSRMVFQDEANKPEKFIVVVYSGIHYDCFITNPSLTEEKARDVGNWTSGEITIVKASELLVHLLQSRNYTTNTTKFRVRCLECYEVLVGEMGASKHAEAKGHYRFGEVS